MTAPSHQLRRESRGDGSSPSAAPGYLEVLRRRGVLVVAGLLAGLLAGSVLAWTLPSEYSSETTLFATTRVAPDDPDAAYSGMLLEQQKAKFYVSVITGPGLGAEVSRLVGGEVDPVTLSSNISAQVPPDSPIIMITAEGRTPEQAVALADAAGRALVEVAAGVEQATSAAGVPSTVLRVVQPPTEPEPASLPGAVLVVLGLVLGLLGGCLAALGRHAWDRSVRSSADLTEVTGTRVLERVPAARSGSDPDGDDPARAEAFVRLRTTLGFLDGALEHRVLAVTGAARGEGTTATVVDLARALAREGRSVVVVDADLRRPDLSDRLGESGSPGLVDVLSEERALEGVVRRGGGGRIDVLGAGPVPPEPADVLASRATAWVVARLRARYDHVLIDTAPITGVADAAIVAAHADAALLVVREGGAARARVAEAADRLAEVVTLLGVVLLARGRTVRPPRATTGRREAAPTEGVAEESGTDQQETAAHERPTAPQPTPRPRHRPEAESEAVAESEDTAADGAEEPVATPPASDIVLRPLSERDWSAGREHRNGERLAGT